MKRIASILLAVIMIMSIGTAVQATEYRLKPGDVLTVSVWGFDELEIKEAIIRPDGKIAFPILGDVEAGGLSSEELTRKITTGISSYIKDPRVTVNIVKFHTTRIYVLGEVVKPGMYELEKQHALLDAIGVAGGYTKDAAKRKVYIIRKDQKQPPLEANLLNLFKHGDMTQNYVLNEGDVVYLASNGRIDLAKDILPFISAMYYIKNFND